MKVKEFFYMLWYIFAVEPSKEMGASFNKLNRPKTIFYTMFILLLLQMFMLRVEPTSLRYTAAKITGLLTVLSYIWYKKEVGDWREPYKIKHEGRRD